MLMNTLYLIRSSSCPTCGLSTKIAAGSSAASRHGYTFANINVNDKVVDTIKEEWDSLDSILVGKNCIFFNNGTGRATDCNNLSASSLDLLFGNE